MGPRRSALALVVGLVAATPAACASAPPPPTREVWVPRAESRGLTIDEGSSRIREIYLPRAREGAPATGRSAAPEGAPSGRSATESM